MDLIYHLNGLVCSRKKKILPISNTGKYLLTHSAKMLWNRAHSAGSAAPGAAGYCVTQPAKAAASATALTALRDKLI